MKDGLTFGGAVAILLAFFAFAIWWQITVWTECRTDHSFMYCVTVLGSHGSHR